MRSLFRFFFDRTLLKTLKKYFTYKVHFFFRWSSRSCLDKYHFICQTKLKTVTKRGKKKLQKQYNATKYNQLNEVPVPVLPEISNSIDDVYKKHMEISNSLYDDNNHLDNVAAAVRSKPSARVKKHKKNNDLNVANNNEETTKKTQKRKKKRRNEFNLEEMKSFNSSSSTEVPRKHRNKMRDFNGMRWKSYYDRSTISPLHPRRIIQEFTY